VEALKVQVPKPFEWSGSYDVFRLYRYINGCVECRDTTYGEWIGATCSPESVCFAAGVRWKTEHPDE